MIAPVLEKLQASRNRRKFMFLRRHRGGSKSKNKSKGKEIEKMKAKKRKVLSPAGHKSRSGAFASSSKGKSIKKRAQLEGSKPAYEGGYNIGMLF